MRTRLLLLIGFIVVVAPVVVAAPPTCLTCHSKLPPSSQRSHDYQEWQQSAHALHGISCTQCHGGDDTAAVADKAHAGILPPSSPTSPLYFNKVPETCGKCHSAELEAFKKSYHYRELERTGHGPNCLTCHGPMATRILTPVQLDQHCNLCHAKRPLANQALVLLNQATQSVARWDEALKKARQGSSNPITNASQLDAARKDLYQLKIQWHTFDMNAVIQNAQKIIQHATQGIANLQSK